MVEPAVSIATPRAEGENLATEVFKSLGKLRNDCGLERGRPRNLITFDQQHLFAHARAQCLDHLTGDARAFIEAKADALELLYELLIFDPLQSEVTANELTTLTKQLQGIMEGIEEKLPRLQAKYAKVYSAALDCLVCHYTLGHLSKVTEDTKQLLNATPEVLKKLNKEDPQVQFYVAYAIEASEKITSDRSRADKFLAGVVNFAKTCHAAYQLDFPAVWEGFRATINEMHFQKCWYEGILFQRKMLREVWGSPENLAAFQQVVADWGLEKKKGVSVSDWKFLMGTIDCLTDLILHSPNPEVARNAFYGSYGGTAPGLLDLIEFKAFKIRKKVKMFDTNWRIRFGVTRALYIVWTLGPEELKISASETLLRHKAREEDDRITLFIEKLLGEDRTLQRSWKQRIIKGDQKLHVDKEKELDGEGRERFKEEVAEFNAMLTQVKQLEEDAALAFNLQSYEYWEAEQRALKKLEAAPPPASPPPPDGLLCPISAEPMYDAVLAPSGYTYSKKSILHWLKGHSTDPFTNQSLSPEDLLPNRVVRDMVEKRFTVTNDDSIPPPAALAASDSTVHRDLFFAAMEGNLEAVREQTNRGAALNRPHDRGNTSLHIASARGFALVVEYLLASGAKANLKNSEGQFPWDLALANGDVETIRLFIDKIPTPLREGYFGRLVENKYLETAKMCDQAWPLNRRSDIRKKDLTPDNALLVPKAERPQLLTYALSHLPPQSVRDIVFLWVQERDDLTLYSSLIFDQPFRKELANALKTTLGNVTELRQLFFNQPSWLQKHSLSDLTLEHLPMLTNLYELRLERCAELTNETWEYISPLTNLKRLSLVECPNLTCGELKPLRTMTSLTRLRLAKLKRLDGSSLKAISHLTNLKRLSIIEAQTSEAHDFNPLVALTALEQLKIYDSPGIAGASPRLKKALPHAILYTNSWWVTGYAMRVYYGE